MLTRWPAMSLKAAESSMGQWICGVLPGGDFEAVIVWQCPRLDVYKGVIFWEVR
jgi:hypothetical protein